MTLTMEPKDWINTGLEDEADGVTVPVSGPERRAVERAQQLRGFEVELKRKPGEGFGFVIASQDVENGKGESQQLHMVQLGLLIYISSRKELKMKLPSRTIWLPAH